MTGDKGQLKQKALEHKEKKLAEAKARKSEMLAKAKATADEKTPEAGDKAIQFLLERIDRLLSSHRRDGPSLPEMMEVLRFTQEAQVEEHVDAYFHARVGKNRRITIPEAEATVGGIQEGDYVKLAITLVGFQEKGEGKKLVGIAKDLVEKAEKE